MRVDTVGCSCSSYGCRHAAALLQSGPSAHVTTTTTLGKCVDVGGIERVAELSAEQQISISSIHSVQQKKLHGVLDLL
jgi:hypothetical protein